MKVLVTGSCGFVGQNLVAHLESKQIEVVTLDYRPSARSGHIEYRLGERRSYPEVKWPSVDWVIHLASESHVDRSIHGPYPFIENNVIGTLELLEAYKKTKIILFSTDEVGACLKTGEFEESFNFNCGSTYSATKGAQELLAQAYAKTFGTEIIITRCVNIFGPHQASEKFIPTVIRNALADKPIPIYGNGMQMRQWVHVDHVCDFLNYIVASNFIPPTILHITGTKEIYNLALARMILNFLDKPSSLISFVEDRLGHDERYALGKSTTDEFGCPSYDVSKFDSHLKSTVDWYKNL